MEKQFIYTQIGEDLKLRARSQGITQVKIATDLGVSIPTVKRWYAGQSLTLVSIKRLSEYLGVSLGELFTKIDNDKNSFEYSLKQEQHLARHPVHLAFYDQLIRGKSVKQIRNKFEISKQKTTIILLALDKIGLIESHEDNKVKLLNSGEPTWRKEGPLSKRFKAEILENFLDKLSKDDSSFHMHEYLKKDAIIIQSKLEELKKYLALANKRASRSDQVKVSYGSYFCFRKFDWDLTKLLK